MNKLSKIVCTPEQSQRLVELGVVPLSALYFNYKTETEYLIGPESKKAIKVLPAWTKYELEVMLGPAMPKADFEHVKPFSFKVQNKQWTRYYQNGAEAAAAGLIYLIEEEILQAKLVSEFMKSYLGY